MKIRIGGQAVTEGVMMRSDNFVSTAVRCQNGKISVRTREYHSITERKKYLDIPIIRGAVTLFEVMSLGIKELRWASNKNLQKNEKLSKKEVAFALLVSVVIAVIIFKLIPWSLANIFKRYFGISGALLSLIDAAFKIIIMILYFYFLGFSKDIKTLFGYHGAEHKTVFCYENKKKLTPQNASRFSRIHPRCGTTFVFIVFIVGLFFYVLIPNTAGFWLNFLVRILLLPVIAGVAYEIIRLEGRYYNNKAVRMLAWPGLQFQRLTTKNPSRKQLEVAIAALNACIKKELKEQGRKKAKL